MNNEQFTNLVVQPLLDYSGSGDTINGMGTRLIGHTPHVAPKAYVHIVYGSLDLSGLTKIETHLGFPIHPQLKSFLSFANGMCIFSGAMRVYGYVPLKKMEPVTAHSYPSDIVIPNISARLNGLDDGDVAVGWYKADSTYVSIKQDGRAVRFDAKKNGVIIQEWTDFDTWLISEVAALNQMYKEGNISIFCPEKACLIPSGPP